MSIFDGHVILLFLTLVLPPARVSVAWWVRARLPKRPPSRRAMHCRTCSYDCSGIWPTARCPECGKPPDPGEIPPPPFLSKGHPLAFAAGLIAFAMLIGSHVVLGMLINLIIGPSFDMWPWYLYWSIAYLLIALFWLGPVALTARRMRRREASILCAAILAGLVAGAATGRLPTLVRAADDPARFYGPIPLSISQASLCLASAAGIAALLHIRLRRRREALAHAPSPTPGATG